MKNPNVEPEQKDIWTGWSIQILNITMISKLLVKLEFAWLVPGSLCVHLPTYLHFETKYLSCESFVFNFVILQY